MAAGKNVKFQGSQISIATTKATAKAITAISQANPAVVTSTAHGYTVGQLVFIAAVVGMTELNGDWYYVQNPLANTFELRGIDSTGYGAYASGGTAQSAVFVNWCECKGWNESGGSSAEIDVSTVCSTTKEYELGLSDTSTVAIDFNYVPKTATQIFLEAAKLTGDTVPMRVTFSAGAGVLTYKVGILQLSRNGQIGAVWMGSTNLRIKENPFLA